MTEPSMEQAMAASETPPAAAPPTPPAQPPPPAAPAAPPQPPATVQAPPPPAAAPPAAPPVQPPPVVPPAPPAAPPVQAQPQPAAKPKTLDKIYPTYDDLRDDNVPASMKCSPVKFLSQKKNLQVKCGSRTYEAGLALKYRNPRGKVELVTKVTFGSHFLNFENGSFTTSNVLEVETLDKLAKVIRA